MVGQYEYMQRDQVYINNNLLLQNNKKKKILLLNVLKFKQKSLHHTLIYKALLHTIKIKVRETIFGVGAPSRASTFINYTGLDDGDITCIVEISGS